jgi:GrpB-like predicted nucleotidyltransferase (UPF0157 family)
MSNRSIRQGWDTGDWTGMPPVTIHPYDPEWVDRYDAARREIEQALAGFDIRIEHVGSTAIPGLGARNSVDILIGLAQEDTAACVERLQQAGFRYHFTKPDWTHLSRYGYKLHMMPIGCEAWNELLLFRDHLRRHPEAVAAYHRLKQDLARQHGSNGQLYVDGKEEFVRSVVRQARDEAPRGSTGQPAADDADADQEQERPGR